MGGLGNQMFQYAAGRQLAALRQTRLVLDTGWFSETPETDTPRLYGLDAFKLEAEIASGALLARLGNAGFSGAGMLYTWLRSAAKFRKFKFYKPGFDPAFFKVRDNAYLKGYFQSARYFEGISPQLREDFQFRDADQFRALPVFSQIRDSLSVSLHVRRGDYLGQSAHVVCTRDYYRKAVAGMQAALGPEMTLFVFSDDLPWAKRSLEFPKTVFVDNSNAELPAADLFLMASCRHHIIANSTFSWWGAWLNADPEKQVLAPAMWAPGCRIEELGLLTETMQTIR